MTSDTSEGAATASAGAQSPAEGRFELVKRHRRLKPAVLKALAPKHKLLIEYMVTGCPHASLSNRVGEDAGVPLTLTQAARVLGIRLRQARDLASQAVFARALAAELQAFREGHKAEAIRRVVSVMRATGDNKAADRRVALDAASMILGDAIEQPSKGVTVNVGLGVAVTPGYVVVRRSADTASEPSRGPLLDVTPPSEQASERGKAGGGL